MYNSINNLISKIDAMPSLMKFLVSLGLATPLIAVAIGVEKNSLSLFLTLLLIFSPTIIGSTLFIIKNKSAPLIYAVGLVIANFSPSISEQTSGMELSNLDVAFNLVISLGISAYLLFNKAVRVLLKKAFKRTIY